MEMLDVIRRLSSLERYANACRQDAESCGDPIAVAEIYQHDAEALRAARAVLEGLERNRAKAENAVKAMQICFGLAQDIERLLTLAYLQGGGDDEQS